MAAPGVNTTPARLFRRSATFTNDFNGPSSFLTLRRDPDGSISYVQAQTTKPMRTSIASDGVDAPLIGNSFVDIASQLVIAVAEHYMYRADPRFPVGRTRLETVGVVGCAVIMTLSTIEVIQSSAYDLYQGILGHLPELDMGPLIVWWIDPAGAILISLYIIWSWAVICKGQIEKIVGMGAPGEFVQKLEDLGGEHHEHLTVDCIRAYYFGARFLVEMEVVLPEHMNVRESHDIALTLQHKVEAFEEVERAFVHVDYLKRDEPEHKLDYNMFHNRSNLMEPHDSLNDSSNHNSLHGKKSGSATGETSNAGNEKDQNEVQSQLAGKLGEDLV
ncbi:hypothetical protein WJX73_005545 [Symbiochloris irregularis]|uniref:Cation efflux protein cytoplasmic domain-containing protein n=1 Tax=Symbiochloris irregularis TaxID=706552 RepID=A0AAW1P041_9CHLO